MKKAMKHRVLMLGGPTASGKTALSLIAAERLGGEIINADSMQVYRGLDILSAQPDAHEKAQAPHHLFSVLEPSERCSVGRWAEMALACMDEVRGRGRVPILVGGTGLYFKALLEGLALIPQISEHIQDKVSALAKSGGIDALEAEAERLDPVGTARLEGADRQRLMRIVAVGYETGQALSELQKETRPLVDRDEVLGIAIQPERATLYARIETRFDLMTDMGALDEAQAIADRNLAPDLPAMKAVGLPPLLRHLTGELELEEALDIAKRDTRRYAKRQFTWFSNQHPDWARIEALDPSDQAAQLNAILDGERSETAG